MKKNSWKRFLCAAALIPCVGAMAGCDQTPTDPATPPEQTPGSGTQTPGQGTLTEAQMYAKLLEVIEKLETGEQKVFAGVATDQMGTTLGEYTIVNQDGTRTPVGAEVKAMLDMSMIPTMEDELGVYESKSNFGYDLTSGQSYSVDSSKFVESFTVEGEPGSEVYTMLTAEQIQAALAQAEESIGNSQFIVKHGNDFVAHNNTPWGNESTYVSADHLLKSEEGYKMMLSQSVGLDGFMQSASFDEYKTLLVQSLNSACALMGGAVVTAADLNTAFELKQIGENYILNAVVSTKEPIVTEGEGMDLAFSVELTQTTAFTDTKLLSNSLNYEMVLDTIVDMPLGADPEEISQVSIPTVMSMDMTVITDNVISTENQTLLNPALYDTDEAVVAEGSVHYYIDGVDLSSMGLVQSGTMGDEFVINEELFVHAEGKVELTDWYLDEACTIPYTTEALSEYTSYAVNLYAKTVSIGEGYFQVIMNTIDNFLEETQMMIFQEIGEYDLLEVVTRSGYDVVSVAVNGQEIDLEGDTMYTFESGQSYVIDVEYVYSSDWE